MMNEWDHVWYGTISTGEEIVATDPPAGNLDPQIYANLDRFTVTFDAPNYVYLDDITVEVTGGTAPTVTQTLCLDNGDPEVIEIVFDGSLPLNEMTRFVFNDGETVNVVAYTLGDVPPIPSASQRGVVVMTVLVLTAGTVILVRRHGSRADVIVSPTKPVPMCFRFIRIRPTVSSVLMGIIILPVLFAGVAPAVADKVLYRYDGDVLPYDASAGWIIANPCTPPCGESLDNGRFVLHWTENEDLANYAYIIAEAPDPPPNAVGGVAIPIKPPPRTHVLWLRWSFRG